MPQSVRLCDIDGCRATHRARGLCSTHYNALIVGETRRHPRGIFACAVCGHAVRRRQDSRYRPTCSTACRSVLQFGPALAPVSSYTWRADAVRRARKYGALIIEAFDREVVFERDGWTCQDCGTQCNMPDPFDRTAATIDHVVALHLGGEHSKANAQTLCLSCNSAKQALAISPAA